MIDCEEMFDELKVVLWERVIVGVGWGLGESVDEILGVRGNCWVWYCGVRVW